MLSVKNLSADVAAKYHEQDDARVEDLPPELQAPLTSSWYGKGAKALGLQGSVQPAQFQQLLNGYDLENNCLHAKPINPQLHRATTEVVFSLPKSPSIALLIQKDYRIFDVHQRAVTNTLDVMEERWACARKANQVTHQQEKVHTGNLAIALFPHPTSRKLDPGFHLHACLMNTTQADTWRALFNDELVGHSKFAGQIYQNECAYGLRGLGYEILPRANGCFELQNYSSDLLKFFSKRRQDIEESASQFEAPLSANAWETIALHTRPRSQHVNLLTLFENWERDIQKNGFVLPPLPLNQEKDLNESGKTNAAVAALVAIEAVAQGEFTFKRERVEAHILMHSLGQQSWQHIQEAINQSDQLICVDEAEHWYGTSESLQQQHEAWQRVQQGRGMGTIATIEEVNQIESEYLVPARRRALELAALCPDQLVIWQGIDPDERGYAEHLYRQLAQEKGYTIHEFSPHSASSTVLEQLQNQSESNQEIWIVRESEKLSAKDLHSLLEHAGTKQAKMLLLGDANRVPYLHAGNPFKWLQKAGVSTANVYEKTPHQQANKVPESSQNTAFEQAEQLKPAGFNHLTKELINASYQFGQTTSPHSAERTGIPLASNVAASSRTSAAKDERLRAACRRLNRSTSSLARSLEPFDERDGIANRDPESIARSIKEFDQRRTFDRVVPEIIGAVGPIHDHLQCIGNNVRQIGEYLRPVEPDRLEEVFRKLAAAEVARSAKQLLDLAGTTAPDGTRSLVDAPLNCTIGQHGSTLAIKTYSGQEKFAYDLHTRRYHTQLSTSALEKSSRVLQERIEKKTEELRYQHLLALVDLAADLNLPPPPAGFLSSKQRDQAQKQESDLRRQLTDKRQDLGDLRLELERAESTRLWLGRGKAIAQKVEQQGQLEQEVAQLKQQLSDTTTALQTAEHAYKIEKHRQKELYQNLTEQVEQRLPRLGQQEIDRSVATLILFAAPPTAERELQINSLRFSPEAQKTNQTSDPGGASTQSYQDQIRKLAEQNLEWFRQQVERYQMEEKQRQKRAQRKQQVNQGEKKVPEQITNPLPEEQLIPATIHDQAEPPTNNQLKQSQRLLEAICRTYEPNSSKSGEPSKVVVGHWDAWITLDGVVEVRADQQTLMRGNVISGKVITPLSEEATIALAQMFQEHQEKRSQVERSPARSNKSIDQEL